MRLTPEQLASFGADGGLLHFVDTAFLVDQPKRIGVAVSGGGDSMALLHVAKAWSDLSGIPIEAVTVDHGLRAEAADEAAMVAAFCAERDIPHSVLQWDGAAATGNIAAAARDARYALIQDWAYQRDVEGILLGHTQDDVAETFLMRLARKSGVDGLALMDTRFRRDDILWARPFWQQTRADLRDYLRRHDVAWAEDATNEDETLERPRMRKALATLAPLGITPEVLKTVALNMASARAALEHYQFEESRRAIICEGGDVILQTRLIPPMPSEIERRLLIAAIRYVNGAYYPPRFGAMIELDAQLNLSGKHTIAGCVVTQNKGVIHISRELNAVEGPLAWTNRTFAKLWDQRWLVSEDPGGNTAGDLEVRALGDSIKDVPAWREIGLPRSTLMASPAVFDGDALLAAPVAGLQNGFEARIVADFASFLLSR